MLDSGVGSIQVMCGCVQAEPADVLFVRARLQTDARVPFNQANVTTT